MDMKRILQAMDGAATKPVAGANEMARFLRAVTEADLNQPAQAPTTPQQDPNFAKYAELMAKYDMLSAEMTPDASGVAKNNSPEFVQQVNALKAQADQLAGTNAQAWEQTRKANGAPQQTTTQLATNLEETNISKFLSIIDKNNVSILNEGSNPHKVSLPVQMAMQHYQQPQEPKQEKPSILKKHLHAVEEELAEDQAKKKQLMRQYASVIAERVMMKEAANPAQQAAIAISKKKERKADESLKTDNPCWKGYHPVGTKKKSGKTVPNCVPTSENTVPGHSMGFKPGAGFPGMQEAPIAMDPAEPNNPMIHSHEKANPMHLKDRIIQARAQLRELAELAESNDLLVWERITRLAQGGMFMGLEQNLEQIRHGIQELAKKRKAGGVTSRGIDKHIGESELKPMAPMKPAKPKAIKAKAKTSPCRSGQVQTGTQIKNGKVVPKCSVR